ncbi:hypothetical protein [Streptomyces sp. ALB3]|uniref:hypothetical protein n=1 Tax=Streptomyces sp. ALB3 TaxID=3374278 RepID=UPI003798AD8D
MAVTKPGQGDRCAVTEGTWASLYDEAGVTDAKKLVWKGTLAALSTVQGDE